MKAERGHVPNQYNQPQHEQSKPDLFTKPWNGWDKGSFRDIFIGTKYPPLENKLHEKQGVCLFLLTGLPLSLTPGSKPSIIL